MLFSRIGIINEDFAYVPDQYVATQGSRIVYVGPQKPEGDFGSVYDGAGKVLMPGMYNIHAHAPMTLLRGYAENLPLDRWLNEMVFPFEAKMTDEDVYPATQLAIAEMLRFGTVSFSDMYYFNDARARAVVESGIKCNLCESALDFAGKSYYDLPLNQENQRIIKQWHGAADGRLLIDYCLHAEYTSHPTLVSSLAQATKEAGVRMQVHVSETKSEVEGCKERHGMTPPAYLASLGLFDQPTTAAHCVWLEEGDFAILREKGVTIATNPASNAKLGSGIMELSRALDEGINVGLGTDGPASNNNHNMFQDLYLMMLMDRARRSDPVGVSPEQALRIATLNGARAQGREDTGAIEEGNRADLCVLNVDVPWMQPYGDSLVGHLAYAAQGSDVVLTMVDGEVLYKDGEYLTIDVERAAFEVEASRKRIVSEL